MTIQEMITEVINDYVSSNGTSSIMDKDQLYAMVSEIYQINKNSFLPADFCYNRTNEGIDFEKHTHLFERLDDGRYLVLGEDYPYSGPVYYRRRGETEDSVRGIWKNGLYEAGAVVADVIELRFNDYLKVLKIYLRQFLSLYLQIRMWFLYVSRNYWYAGLALKRKYIRFSM